MSFTLKNKKAKILCDQIKCVGVERFKDKIGILELKTQKKLKEILK